jgi:hypothetical protein
MKEMLEDDIASCGTFTNLKSLEIERWAATYDFHLLACFIKLSPSLQEIILHLNGVISLSLSLSLSLFLSLFFDNLDSGCQVYNI